MWFEIRLKQEKNILLKFMPPTINIVTIIIKIIKAELRSGWYKIRPMEIAIYGTNFKVIIFRLLISFLYELIKLAVNIIIASLAGSDVVITLRPKTNKVLWTEAPSGVEIIPQIIRAQLAINIKIEYFFKYIIMLE